MIKINAIRVVQPIGEFYLCSINADTLSNLLHKRKYNPSREENDRGASELMCPGSIVIAGNVDSDGTVLTESDCDKRWSVELVDGSVGDIVTINIPTNDPMGVMLDGFKMLDMITRKSGKYPICGIPASIFLDIPRSYQATIMAHLNYNRDDFDRLDVWEYFNYNWSHNSECSWSPEKLATFFSRKLDVDDSSPFKGRVEVMVEDDVRCRNLAALRHVEWVVPANTLIDGIVGLISYLPLSDEIALYGKESAGARSYELPIGKNPPPMRKLYFEENRDTVIYKAVMNFFTAVRDVGLWARKDWTSVNGIKALFKLLNHILPELLESKDLTVEKFMEIIEKIKTNMNGKNISIYHMSVDEVVNFLISNI